MISSEAMNYRNHNINSISSNENVQRSQVVDFDSPRAAHDIFLEDSANNCETHFNGKESPKSLASGINQSDFNMENYNSNDDEPNIGVNSSSQPYEEVYKPCQKNIEIKLFVGRLPKTMDSESLQDMFSQFGSVFESIIICDKVSGAHKGSGFVKMTSITDADRAIRDLHGIKILDKQLGPIQVKYANGEPERLGLTIEHIQPGQNVGKLFVGSLPKSVTEKEIRACFEEYGNIEEVIIIKDSHSNFSKGCAFVKFSFKEDAINSIINLHQKFMFPGSRRPLEVKFAENRRVLVNSGSQVPSSNNNTNMNNMFYSVPRRYGYSSNMNTPVPFVKSSHTNYYPRTVSGWTEYFTTDGRPYYHNDVLNVTQWAKPAEFNTFYSCDNTMRSTHKMTQGTMRVGGPLGANVFIFHLPSDWTQNEIESQFSNFGNIISCYVATDRNTKKNKGFGFVSYENIESAAYAVLAMDGYAVGSKRLKVSIKVGEEKYVEPFLAALRAQNINNNMVVSQNVSSYSPSGNLNSYRATPY